MHREENQKRKPKISDANRVRFKPVVEEYEDRYLSSNDEGSDHIRPSSLAPRRRRSQGNDSDNDLTEQIQEHFQRRPLSVKQAVPFASNSEEEDEKEVTTREEKHEEKEDEDVSNLKVQQQSGKGKRGSVVGKETSAPMIGRDNNNKRKDNPPPPPPPPPPATVHSPKFSESPALAAVEDKTQSDLSNTGSPKKTRKRSILSPAAVVPPTYPPPTHPPSPPPVVTTANAEAISAEELTKRTRLKSIFEEANASSDTTMNDHQDKYGKPRPVVTSEGEEDENQSNDEEKYRCFELFEIAEKITNGQMMKIKTGVAGNLPLQDSFPLFKSSKQYLIIYWSVLLPQDDWSLVFFDELIDENYFAMNYFQQQQQIGGATGLSPSPIDRPNLLKLSKKIVPLSEVSEVFLDQKTTTSFRFYRGQEVTNCTPLPSSSSSSTNNNIDFPASVWADAIYSILQLQNFHDDELLQKYYQEYFTLLHPQVIEDPETDKTAEEQESKEETTAADNKNSSIDPSANGEESFLKERLSFNTELFRATKGLRTRGLSEDSANNSRSNRSNSPAASRPADENNHSLYSQLKLPFFGKKKSQRKTSIFSSSSPPLSPTAPQPSPGKRSSIIQTVKNMFTRSATPPRTFKDDAPKKLFEAIEDENIDEKGNTSPLKGGGGDSNTNSSPTKPGKASRRWTMFSNNALAGQENPKRNKGIETSIPLADLEKERQEALKNLKNFDSKSSHKRRFDIYNENSSSLNNTDPASISNQRLKEEIEKRNSFREGNNNSPKRPLSFTMKGDNNAPSMDTLQQSIIAMSISSTSHDRSNHHHHHLHGKTSPTESSFTRNYGRTESYEEKEEKPTPFPTRRDSSTDTGDLLVMSSSADATSGEEKRDTATRTKEDGQGSGEEDKKESKPSEDLAPLTIPNSEVKNSAIKEKLPPMSPAQQLGRHTVLDYLYEQSKSPSNRPAMNIPFLDHDDHEEEVKDVNNPTNRNKKKGKKPKRLGGKEEEEEADLEERQTRLYERQVQQLQQKEYQEFKSYQQLHKDLMGIKIQKQNNKKNKSNTTQLEQQYILEKDAFHPQDQTKRTIAVEDPLTKKKLTIQNPSILSPTPSKPSSLVKATPPPTTTTAPPAASSTATAVGTTFSNMLPWNLVKSKSKGSPNQGNQSDELEGSKQEQGGSKMEGKKASPRSASLLDTAHHNNNNPVLSSSGGEDREGQLLEFLRGKSHSLPPSTSIVAPKRSNDFTPKPLTNQNLAKLKKEMNKLDEEEEEKAEGEETEEAAIKRIKHKSSSMITLPDTGFFASSSREKASNIVSADEPKNTKKKGNTTTVTSPPGKLFSPSSNNNANSNNKTANKNSKLSFQNYYSKGMISDSEESYHQKLAASAVLPPPVGFSSVKRSHIDFPLSPSKEKKFHNDHSKLIEREKEREARLAAVRGGEKPVEERKGNASGEISEEKEEEGKEEEEVIKINAESEKVEMLTSKYSPPPQSKKRSNPSPMVLSSNPKEAIEDPSSNHQNPFSQRPTSAKRASTTSSNGHAKEEEERHSNSSLRRAVSPVKDRTALKRIFGSMTTNPFEDVLEPPNDSINTTTAKEERRKSHHNSSKRGSIADMDHSQSSTKPTKTATATVSSSSSTPLSSNPASSSPMANPPLILPSLLSVYYYKAATTASLSQRPINNNDTSFFFASSSSPSFILFYKYEITLSVLSKFELQTKLMTTNRLISHRIGIHHHPPHHVTGKDQRKQTQKASSSASSNQQKGKKKNENNNNNIHNNNNNLSLLASNIIIAELLESAYYLQFHAKNSYPAATTTLSPIATPKGTTAGINTAEPTQLFFDEYVFVPIEDILAIDFDAKLSGLFRLFLYKSIHNHEFPIIYSYSSGLSSFDLQQMSIFQDFSDILRDTSSTKGGNDAVTSSSDDAIECLLKAKNVVELQMWLQLMITLYHQQVRSASATIQPINYTNRQDDNVPIHSQNLPTTVPKESLLSAKQEKSQQVGESTATPVATNNIPLPTSPQFDSSSKKAVDNSVAKNIRPHSMKRSTLAGTNVSSSFPSPSPSIQEFKRKNSSIL